MSIDVPEDLRTEPVITVTDDALVQILELKAKAPAVMAHGVGLSSVAVADEMVVEPAAPPNNSSNAGDVIVSPWQ